MIALQCTNRKKLALFAELYNSGDRETADWYFPSFEEVRCMHHGWFDWELAQANNALAAFDGSEHEAQFCRLRTGRLLNLDVCWWIGGGGGVGRGEGREREREIREEEEIERERSERRAQERRVMQTLTNQ